MPATPSDPAVRALLDGLGPAAAGARVAWARHQRHDTTLLVGPGGSWLVKRRGAPTPHEEPSLDAELGFHRMLRRHPLPPAVRVPGLAAHDEQADVLIFHGLPDATSLRAAFLAGDPGVGDAAEQVGAALGALHRTPVEWARPWGVATNPVQTHGRVTPETVAHGPRATAELLRLLQAEPHVNVALRRLRDDWRPSAVVHGDVKSDNVLLQDGQAYLIDWELAGVGDPAWDCGAFLGSLLFRWAESMRSGTRAGDPSVLAAARLFWTAYAEVRSVDAAFDADAEQALAFRWAGYWLVHRVFAILPLRRAVAPLDLTALHLAGHLLREGMV